MVPVLRALLDATTPEEAVAAARAHLGDGAVEVDAAGLVHVTGADAETVGLALQLALDRFPADGVDPFAALVQAAPDAILVVDADGTITAANDHVEALFGWAPGELVGQPIETLVPLGDRGVHVAERAAFLADPSARPMASGRDLEGLHRDGRRVPVDIALAPFDSGGGVQVAAFVRDASPRRHAEDARRREALAAARRRQALELNDQVVQGLVGLLWRLDAADSAGVRDIAERTLAAARAVLRDLLDEDDRATAPGELVRTNAAPTTPAAGAPSAPATVPDEPVDGPPIRVLVADDDADLRFLLALHLRSEQRVEIVGEASDGQGAVDLATELRPDVVLLDLSMPRMDGLQAAELIRAELPDARVVVLSGYPASRMRQVALAAGADDYLEKTADLAPVARAVLGAGAPLA